MGCGKSKDSGTTAPSGGGGGEAPASREDSTVKTTKSAKETGKKKKNLLQVLVAGYQQSGKSTFFKQLQIIHLNGWSAEEKKQLLVNLKSNIIQGMKELIEAAGDQDVEFEEDIQSAVELFEEKNPFDEDAVDAAVVENAKSLWKHKQIQDLWEQKDSLPNMSCINLDYIMENIDRITASDAVPNDEDVLRTRNRTTGTVELEFSYEGKQDFKFVDVGGQKSERRKWSQVIEHPNAVLYFTSLPDYDVPVMVDSDKTKMSESVEIWQSVCEEPSFSNSVMILFLNKVDLFDEKIKKNKGMPNFSDYKGGADADAGSKYILGKFQDSMPDGHGKDTLQVHTTCALDTEQIRTVWLAIRGAMTERKLTAIGF
jgi:GTPase SAR1 family protein